MGLYHLVDKNTKRVIYADKEEAGGRSEVTSRYPDYRVIRSATGQPNAPLIQPGFLYYDSEFWAVQKMANQVTSGNVTVSKDEFLRLFTFEELIEIYNFADSTTLNGQAKRMINAFLRYLDGITSITLSHPTVTAGLSFFEDSGYLSASRRAEIVTATFKQ